MSLAENIRNARIKAKLNQEELAQMIGVKKATISLYENGAREPDALKIIAIGKALGVTGDYLLDFPTEPALSPEALDLARKYDAIADEHARNVIRTVVGLEYEHHAQPKALPTSEWLFAHAINAPDAEDQSRSG